MATKFLEPGGDANFLTPDNTDSFWSGGVGSTPTLATDFVHGSHIKSIKYATGFASYAQKNSVVSDSGGRISYYIYIATLPSSISNILVLIKSNFTTVASLKVTSAGVLQLFETTSQIGSNGPTLSSGVWYRVSLAYTVTSTTVNRFEVFVDGVSAISVTNATLSNTTMRDIRFGASADAAISFRSSDHYIDDSTSLVDTGNIWVTAKRPNANGTSNNFTTQIGSGGSGYGSGHSPQVNERPISATNGWSVIAIGATTEEYNIENVSTGDINISGTTIIDFAGWVSAKAILSETGQIIINNVASNISLTSTRTTFVGFAGSSSYPAGTGTDIGIISDATATTVSLYDCGIVVAYNFTLSISVSDSITVSESISGQRIGGAWVAVDNFNSYSDGELGGDNGGSGWSDAWEAIFGSGFMVEGSVTNEGAKAISFSDDVQAIAWYKRDLTRSVSSGIVSFAMRVNALDNPGVEVGFTDTSFEHARVRLGHDSDLLLSTNDGEVFLLAGTVSADTWYTVHVEIDGVNSAFRGRVGNNQWSDWVYEIANPFSDITRMIIYMDVSTPGGIAYFDTIGAGTDPVNTYNISVSDSVTVSESLSVKLSFSVSTFESTTLTENTSFKINTNLSVFDSITVSEVRVLAILGAGVFTDTVFVSENISLLIPLLYLSVFDTVVVTESLVLSIPDPSTVFESVTVNENIKIVSVLMPKGIDSVALSENLAFYESLVPLLSSVTDNISVAEQRTLEIPVLLLSYEAVTVVTGPFTLFFNGYQMPGSRPLGDIAYYYAEGSSTAPQMGLSIGGGL